MAAIVNSAAIPELTGTRYPPPHDAPCRARAFKRLAASSATRQATATPTSWVTP